MHRGINRLVRSACLKWNGAENAPPSPNINSASPSILPGDKLWAKSCWNTEDTSQANSGSNRKSSDKKDAHSGDSFSPNKHSWGEAFCVTSGLILTYQVTHRKNYLNGCSSHESSPVSQKSSLSSCPLSTLATKVSSQPLLTSVNINSNVIATNNRRSKRSGRQRQDSIDTTPFLKEELNDISNFKLDGKENDDFVIQFSSTTDSIDEIDQNKENIFKLKKTTPLLTKKVDDLGGEKQQSTLAFLEKSLIAKTAKKLTADIFNVLGAYEFVKEEKKIKSVDGMGSNEPPIHALDLLNKGMELGSSRAIYNIGVAYDRLNRVGLAKEYYKKAADLGHPLGAYNSAMFALQEGKLNEGFELLKYAAEQGVPEAKAAVNFSPAEL